MKSIIIIPARYTSSRFPGKPLAVINEKPMIYWTYSNCKKSKYADEIIVATDDSRINDTCKKFGAKVIITSKKHKSGTDRIIEVIKKMRLDDNDIIINVQGDEPLINPINIDIMINELRNNKLLNIVTLKTELKENIENPNIVKVVTDKNKNALYFSRSPIPFIREKNIRIFKHMGVYAYRKKALVIFHNLKSDLEDTESLEQLRFLENGIRIKVLETKHDSIGVDTKEDLEKIEEILNDKNR